MSKGNYNFIFAAGGTGGHLYPAIAVAENVRMLIPEANILFVGTKSKIEANVIPRLGYTFKTIWLSGFSRKFVMKNILFPVKLIVSLFQSLIININYKPNVAIGAGAYVSGPVIWIASKLGSKVVLLEQNSYPGVTNRMLEKSADSIHLSFQDSEKYFKEKAKLKITGNPVRTSLKLVDKSEAIKDFNLDIKKKVILIIGGSLGAASINKAVADNIDSFIQNKLQVIWQTGELYYNRYKHFENESVKVKPFISEMEKAFSASDLIVARAGATTIAEAAYLGLPVIFVPSTNVAANHQLKNAKSIFNKNGCIIIEDNELDEKFKSSVISTINDDLLLSSLRKNIKEFSKPNAAYDIALDVIRLAKE